MNHPHTPAPVLRPSSHRAALVVALRLLVPFVSLSQMAVGETIFSENFDSLPLEDSIEEPNAGTAVWTRTAPPGWEIDNDLMFKGFWDPDPA
ncbi:MAG: hypothetical protein ACKV19_24615, partial [Verrucomicrobiales bacterium]